MRTPSPLRYPGGKTVLYSMVSDLIRKNDLERGHYAEPYAGGAGLALSLLFNNVMRHIHINDVDPAIWAFWDSILNHTKKFVRQIERTEVTIEEWHKQRDILKSKSTSSFKKRVRVLLPQPYQSLRNNTKSRCNWRTQTRRKL